MLFLTQNANAQIGSLNSLGNQYSNTQNGSDTSKNKNNGLDELKHRDHADDSINISFHYFDSAAYHRMDSSINDFDPIMPAPYTYTDLGNAGSPAKSLLFKPFMKPGFDAGFHSMDAYRYTLEGTRYFTTTKPYTSLGYIMGSKSEQYIDVLHTQNKSQYLNFGFEFHLNSNPGSFKNQNANTSTLRFNISTHSKNLRYTTNFIWISNSLKASTNGGIISDSALTNNALGDPFDVPTKLASSSTSTRNPFKTNVTTGNIFSDKTIFFRHSYDLGQKDSVMDGDSLVKRLFYPRIRFEHTISYKTSKYEFIDANPIAQNYLQYYNMVVPSDTFQFKDQWKDITNEFAIYTFPDKKNQSQFLKLYGGYQHLEGKFGRLAYYPFINTYVGFDYRNRTKNRKWDLVASGKFYSTGNYAGNYSAYVGLKRFLPGLGAFQLEGENVNRTPSFIYKSSSQGNLSFTGTDENINYIPHSNFPITGDSTWKNENITRVGATLEVDKLNLILTGNYYLYTNYTYFDGLFSARQYGSVFNLLEIGAHKTTNISKHFRWYADVYLQKKAGGAPINLPLILMRHRISYENQFFRNLFIATGFSVRYYSPYKADNYSPFTGQYFYQDQTQISNRPDISYYFNFRILRFRFYSEFSNLNTLNYSKTQGLGFNHYNYRAPLYPASGMWFRFGFKWMFIN